MPPRPEPRVRAELGSASAKQAEKVPTATPLAFDAGSDVIPGWQLTFTTAVAGYWFMIKDKTDPCGFAYISNQDGVIYTAEPIR